jgi:hypothetical protein
MLAVLIVPVMVACGDDDDSDGGGTSAFTESEIVELLTGKWEVYGECEFTNYDTKESFSDNYIGNIEFKADKTLKFKVSEGTKYSDTYTYDGQTYNYDYYIEEAIIDTNTKYSVLKKGGRNYISLGSSSDPFNFEIVSLTKNTFKLKLNYDVYDPDNKARVIGKIYMTIISN